MKKKLASLVLVTVLVSVGLLICIGCVSAATIYVPDDYPTVHDAVNAASDDDTIVVCSGVYTKDVDVGKSLMIKSENGAEVTVVQAVDSDDNIFGMKADYVNYTDGLSLDFANPNWSVERITYGFLPSLCFDSGDIPHISYYDGGHLAYAIKEEDKWCTEKVDSDGDGWWGQYSSIALDSNGTPHISYVDVRGSNDKLMYAMRNADNWTLETVDFADLIQDTSLAIDQNDNVWITYCVFPGYGPNRDLKFALKSNDSWDTGIIDYNGYYNSMTLDSQGHPRVVYYDYVNEKIKYAEWTGSVWSTQIVDSGKGCGWSCGPSIDLDSNDNPHMAYRSSAGVLKYAKWDGSLWIIETVEGYPVSELSLAVDSNGNPHIGYKVWSELRYAVKEGEIWKIEKVSKDMGDAGLSLALNQNNNKIGIVFEGRNVNGDLKYAERDYSVLLPPIDRTYGLVTVISPENITYYLNSIDLDYFVNMTTSWVGYSLDGGANETLTGSVILKLTNGPHSITLYAIDTSGNTYATSVSFTVHANPAILFTIPNEVRVSFMVGEEFWEPKTEFQIGEWIGLTLEGEELRGGSHPAIANNTTFVISDEVGNVIWNRSVGRVGEGWSSGPGGGWGVGVSWGQVNRLGNPVPAGNYRAGVMFTDPTFNFSEDFSGVIPLTIEDITTSPPEEWSEDIRLTNNRTALDHPSIAVDSGNNIHILWTDSRAGYWNLYYMKLDNNGDKLIDDIKITPGACSQFTECSRQIAADSQGNVHIVWQNNRAIYYTKLDNGGDVIIANKFIGGGGSLYYCYPSIAIDSNDNIHVIFNKRLDEVCYVKLDNNGNVLKTIRVDSWGSYTSAIAIDSKNNVHLTWPNSGIKYAKFDNDGDKLVDNLKVSDIYKSDETQPAITIDSADNVHIVWNTNTQIYYAKLDSCGNIITTDKLVSNITGAWGYSYLSTAIDTKDNLHVVWQDSRDGNSEIYYKRLDNESNCLSNDIRLTSYGGASMSPSIAVDSNNKVHVVWYDNRHGFSDIYYKNNCGEVPPENQLPIASFTFEPQNPVVSEEITFDASASTDPDGKIVSYEWNFGDGNTGSGKIVTYAYSSKGSYIVKLTVTDNDGATDTETKVIDVSPLPGMLDVPFFSQREPAWRDKKLDHSSYSIGEYGCALTSVAMVSKYFGYDTDPDRLNTSLTEVGGLDASGILYWEKVEEVSNGKVEWYGSVEASWSRIDQELSKKYPVISSVKTPLDPPFDIHFIVFIGKDENRYYFLDPSDDQKTINVWPNGALGKYTIDKNRRLKIYHGNLLPVASFSFSPSPPYNPVIGEDITFDASDSYDPDGGTITNYKWDFGDGSTEEGADKVTVTHSYSSEENYAVTLTVTDDEGTTNSNSKIVTVKKPPVVLVHGFQSDNYDPEEIWKTMKGSLINDGFTVQISHYANDMVTNLPIQVYAGNFDKEIENIRRNEEVDKVDVVAHSMGGLVVRWYIEMGGGDKNVRKLIMLETPNGGLLSKPFPAPEIATLILAGTDPKVTTIADSVDSFINKLPFSEEVKTIIKLVKINAYIYSNLGRVFEVRKWDSAAGIYAGMPHVSKGVIEKVHYVNIVGWLHYVPGASSVFDLENIATENVPISYGGLHGNLPKNEWVIQKVKEILHDDPEVYDLKQEECNTWIQYTPLISDRILPNEEKSHEIAIGSTTMADITLTWSRGDLNLTLITPNGTIIDPPSASNETNITYYSDENLTIEGYNIKNPESGIWKINVTAVNISEEENYTITTLLETNMTLSLSLQKYQYEPNEPINISANLTYGNEAITNAYVTAKIKRPYDATENITLFDDGLHNDNQTNDGIYANMYTNTSSWGTYDITVTASGGINEEQFGREAFATVWVEQYPDLMLNRTDISFSNDNPNPGENVTINATIHNIGKADANNASIIFYDGEPASGDKIGEDVVNVTANGTANASILWTTLSGIHHIYVLISPYNEFLEEDYTNNLANETIKVNTLPIANFTFIPEKPVVNQTITFNASASYDPYGNITNYEWDFGDGNITNTIKETINHSYSEAGSYLVNLTVTDDDGATNATNKTITVYNLLIIQAKTNKSVYEYSETVVVSCVVQNETGVNITANVSGSVKKPDGFLEEITFDEITTGNYNASYTNTTLNGTYHVTISANKVGYTDTRKELSFRVGVAELTSIEVSPSTATLNVGDAQQFSAIAYDQYGNVMPDVIFSWSSSNTTVGTVNTTGFFTANTVGTTTITATNGTVSGTATVTVIKPIVTIDSYELALNREIVIPVKIRDATNIAGGSMTITYNTSIVNAISVSCGHFGEPAYNIDNTNGSVSIACAKMCAVNRTEAVLANIVFKGIGEGFTPLRIQNAKLNDEEGNVMYPGTFNGSITVRSYMTGDVNHNNMLDTGDATLVLRMIVGLKEQDMLGDMNSNGMIDTGDATLILRRIVGLI